VLKRISAVLAGAVVALVAVGVTPSSAVVPDLTVVKVGYNAAGPDTLVNRWQEYVDLRNTSGGLLNVRDWSVQDAWAHEKNGNNPVAADCNTAIFTKAGLPWLDKDADDDGTEDGLWLPNGHTIRVYTGGAADNSDNSQHSMVLNRDACGYNGHYLNNLRDSIYVKRANGTLVTKFVYDFTNGYYTS
jgi:hypothetical protein